MRFIEFVVGARVARSTAAHNCRGTSVNAGTVGTVCIYGLCHNERDRWVNITVTWDLPGKPFSDFHWFYDRDEAPIELALDSAANINAALSREEPKSLSAAVADALATWGGGLSPVHSLLATKPGVEYRDGDYIGRPPGWRPTKPGEPPGPSSDQLAAANLRSELDNLRRESTAQVNDLRGSLKHEQAKVADLTTEVTFLKRELVIAKATAKGARR